MRFDGKWLRLLALALGMGALGCADFHRGPAPADGGGDDATGDTTLVSDFAFETTVYPILQRRCQDCHSVGRIGEYTGLVLTGNARMDRAMVLALVVPGDPAAGLLLRKATGERHTGQDVLTKDTPEYDTIASWIEGLKP
jgi:hypothetical protein